MDIFDSASEVEMRDRERSIRIALSAQHHDYESEICPGCSYATETNFGKGCDGWADCLRDHERRERAGR